MTSVYNFMRNACGISQAEAAELHGARLDTVKSWSADRREAPAWAINHLQSLLRRMHAAGTDYADMMKARTSDNAFILGEAADDADARALGFPSLAAQQQSLAIAIAQLPDDAEVRIVTRIRGAIPAPTLSPEKILPTQTDRKVLMTMRFLRGECVTRGPMNRRKFERLEAIGWIKGRSINDTDVQYQLTSDGKALRQFRPGDQFRFPEDPKLYTALFVQSGHVTLMDEGGRRSVALAVDIGNCWVDEKPSPAQQSAAAQGDRPSDVTTQ